MICFCLYIQEHYNVTQLQHVLLGILSVRQQPLKESVAKADVYSWKVRLHCLPIPAEGIKSNRAYTTLLLEKKVSSSLKHCIIWSMYFISRILLQESQEGKRQCHFLISLVV